MFSMFIEAIRNIGCTVAGGSAAADFWRADDAAGFSGR